MEQCAMFNTGLYRVGDLALKDQLYSPLQHSVVYYHICRNNNKTLEHVLNPQKGVSCHHSFRLTLP